jgi:hypothetical protein
MDADDLLKRDGSQGKGISIPKITGCGEGKFCDIFEGLDIFGLDARLIETFSVKFGVFVDMIYRPLKPLQLKPLQFPLRPDLRHESFPMVYPLSGIRQVRSSEKTIAKS